MTSTRQSIKEDEKKYKEMSENSAEDEILTDYMGRKWRKKITNK